MCCILSSLFRKFYLIHSTVRSRNSVKLSPSRMLYVLPFLMSSSPLLMDCHSASESSSSLLVARMAMSRASFQAT